MDLYELNILEVINKHSYVSQRDISSEIGISLGMVNLLLKRFIKIGWIKIERLDGKKVKYILTPSGLAYLSKKTIDYISNSYNAVVKIKSHMKIKIKQYLVENEVVYVYGPKDEIFEILMDLLKEEQIKYQILDHPTQNEVYFTWGEHSEGHGIDILGEVF